MRTHDGNTEPMELDEHYDEGHALPDYTPPPEVLEALDRESRVVAVEAMTAFESWGWSDVVTYMRGGER